MTPGSVTPGRRVIALLGVLALVAWFNAWVLDTRHFFFADDWGWLWRAQFQAWTDTIHLLPTSVYNDRPGGEGVLRLLFAAFWLRAGPYNLTLLLIHLVNCTLLFLIARPHLGTNRALLATLLAGCWFSTLTAVHWIGAIFDLVGATWCLTTLACYVQATGGKASRAWLVAALVFHLLAIRTKELALALVVVLAAWDFLLLESATLRQRLVRLGPHALLTLAFLVVYARLFSDERQSLDQSAYAMSFSVSGLVEAVGYYFAQAFYAFTPGSNETNVGIGIAFAVGVAVCSATSRFGIAALLSAAATCAAVLLLSRQRHPLYLYVPHFFIAAALCSLRPRSVVASIATAVMVAVLLAWPAHTGYLRDARNFVLVKGGYSQRLFYDYARLVQGRPTPRAVRVLVAETYFDPFSWGPGSAIQIYHRDSAIRIRVQSLADPPPSDCTAPATLCLREQGGRLVLKPASAP